MSRNFDKRLMKLLETDRRFTDQNGRLIKRAVIDRAWRTDHQLVRLLLSDPEVKAKFFDKIAGAMVFNASALIDYISGKKFLGDSYTRFRNKIGLNIDGKFLKERGEVSLVWPYKDCVLEGGQTKEEETRKEIFFNELLAHDEINRLFDPKILTNWKRHTAKGAKPVADIKRDKSGLIRENLIVKGNNLLALHTLKQQFRGKVKLIYIDPPYNTGGAANTFLYNNNFNHSAWLTFMKNRLEISRDMLSKDGLAVIAIDHEELLYVGVLADEIFSRRNRIGIISVQTNPGGRSDAAFFATSSEFFLVYAKEKEEAAINLLPLTEEQKTVFKFKDEVSPYKWCPFRRSGSNSTPADRPNLFYPIFYNKKTGYAGLEKQKGAEKIIPLDSNGVKRVWRQSKERFMEAAAKGDIRIKKGPRGYIIDLKDRIKEGRKPKTIWTEPKYDASSHGTQALKKMFNERNVFSYPKSRHLMKDIIKITTEKNDLILDFFSGSGTTAEAVLALNHEDKGSRQFILCEQMDYIKSVTMPRVLHAIKNNKEEKKAPYALDPDKAQGQINAFEEEALEAPGGQNPGKSKRTSKKSRSGPRSKQAKLSINCENNSSKTAGGKTKSPAHGAAADEASFICCELMKYNEAYMDKIQAAKTSKELAKLWKDISKNSFLKWYVNPEAPEEALNDFIKIGEGEGGGAMAQSKNKTRNSKTKSSRKLNAGQKSAAGQKDLKEWKNRKYIEKTFRAALEGGKTGLERQKRLLAELLNKNQLYVHLSEIDDRDFKVSKEDKRLNKLFFGGDK